MLRRLFLTGLVLSLAPYTVSRVQALELDAAQIAKRKEVIHSCLLQIYLNQKRAPQAKEEFAAMTGLKPNDSKLRFSYGSFLASHAEFEAAGVQLKKAIQLDPVNPNYSGTLGLMYLKAKKFELAAKYLKDAVEKGGKEYLKPYQDVVLYLQGVKRANAAKKQQQQIKQQQAAPTKSNEDDEDW